MCLKVHTAVSYHMQSRTKGSASYCSYVQSKVNNMREGILRVINS